MRLFIYLNVGLTCLFAHTSLASEINRQPAILGPATDFPVGENATDYAWLENFPNVIAPEETDLLPLETPETPEFSETPGTF